MYWSNSFGKYLSMFDNVVEQLSSWNIFHYHENVRWSANYLIPRKFYMNISKS